jgi:hypothetical protein
LDSQVLKHQIDNLKGVILVQLELLKLCLFVSSEGSTSYQEEKISCTLPEEKVRASTMIAMAAGQSVHSILKMTDLRGIPVRDIYPIARCAIESFINAAYLVAEDESASARAIQYIPYAWWKQRNRTVGQGDMQMKLQSSEPIPDEEKFFRGRGNDSWTNLNASERIQRISEKAGPRAGSRLQGGYVLIYSISSQIIHGSPFGVAYFFSKGRTKLEDPVDDFRASTGLQIVDVLVATAHGLGGYLHTFFRIQGHQKPLTDEEKIFNRLLTLEGVEPQPLSTL